MLRISLIIYLTGSRVEKLIIEAHHGSVSVNNNEDGRGVSFRIIIPKYNMKRKAK